jgi:uracil-DNA glycosylase
MPRPPHNAGPGSPGPRAIDAHRAALLACRRCTTVIPPVICGPAVEGEIYLLGQAPGVHEGEVGRPFGWTAGRTLFRWIAGLGVTEEQFRSRVFMSAVIRCFPGKAPAGGGDRVPGPAEIAACSTWIREELRILRPRLVIAVGRLAIEQLAGPNAGKLEVLVGPLRRGTIHGHEVDWVALPHPSGVSAWPKVEPGRTLLAQALEQIALHPSWRRTFPPG